MTISSLLFDVAVLVVVLAVGRWIYNMFFAKIPDYFEDEFGQKYRINEVGGKVNVDE